MKGPDATPADFTPAGLDAILREAEAAARAAGEVLLAHYGHIDRAEVASKSVARDLVTKADVAAERELVARLRRAFPDHAIEAEEEVRDALDAPTDAARPRWFLDPLDGTVNFVHGIPVFSVSMGLYLGREPLVGVVHAPKLGETFTARLGGGAFLDGRRIRVSDCARLSEAVLATGFPYRRNELPNNNVANFDALILAIRGIRRMGSAAVDLAYVAAGRLDGYWELHLQPHDVAAGALLVREAGGIVRDMSGGEDWLRGKNVVAAGAGIFEELRGRVRA
ncbi:MAG: inositol monophosphatase family protein [Planctomycetota bacterium]|nr:inositol monophosphatase family protein [Planctomycetota bacterium]